MQYPIKYIENNLVWNHDGECFAYYELIPYNYSFLSVEQKEAVHDAFRQLIAQNRDGKIHALQISTESSIRAAQERSKAYASGNLREAALRRIDGQTEALVSMIGENQVDYRFYIGFKLLLNEQDSGNIGRQAANIFSGFLRDVNHTLMGDFASMPNDEILRYQKMEKLLESKISRRFKVRRLDKDDFGYLLEHLYGKSGTAYEDYEFHLPKKKLKGETLVKRYDLTVKNAEVTVKDADGKAVEFTKAEDGTLTAKVPENAEVTVKYTAPTDAIVFDLWSINSDAKLDVNVKENPLTFKMPAQAVTIEAMTQDATIESEGPGVLGTAAMIGVAGAGTVVLGYTGYMIGTELYLNTVLPAGAAIPQNTTELAKLLWTEAGKPAPAAVMAEDATDEQKALTWAVESQLISADKPADASVGRWEVIRGWNRVKEMK